MTTLGFCTHFTETDEWAFEFAMDMVQKNDWRLNICHWLESPYRIRRDIVFDDLFDPRGTTNVSPRLLARLEMQLREYYEPKLGDFTDVGFKLCEGEYQIELIRCFRNNLLDIVVMGFQPPPTGEHGLAKSMQDFAMKVPFPLILVGVDGPGSFLLNHQAEEIHDQLALPAGSWKVLEWASL